MRWTARVDLRNLWPPYIIQGSGNGRCDFTILHHQHRADGTNQFIRYHHPVSVRTRQNRPTAVSGVGDDLCEITHIFAKMRKELEGAQIERLVVLARRWNDPIE